MKFDFYLREDNPISDSDCDLVRLINKHYRDILTKHLSEWPQWAREEAQKIANYRRWVLENKEESEFRY